MKSIKILGYFMKLVRWPNLLLIVTTMFLMRYFIIKPMLAVQNMQLQMTFFHFILLVISTGLIAAAGYIINDYFDRKTDLINRPYKVIVGRFIKRRIAIVMHTIFNFFGVILGIYISFKNDLDFLSIIYILSTGLLWFYSTNYKKQLLVGNLVVAILTAMLPLMVILYEIPLLNRAYKSVILFHQNDLNIIIRWIAGFAYFAFLTTLIREMVKDTEDLIGDQAYGRVSIPMVIGEKYTKLIILVLTLIMLFSVIFIAFTIAYNIFSLTYISLLIVLPIIYFVFLIIRADQKKDWRQASIVIKLVMICGILYTILFKYLVVTNFSV